MGAVKEWMMEQEARGYSELEGDVCAECFNDEFLKKYIKTNSTSTSCNFCGQTSDENIAMSLDEVAGLIWKGIFFDWSTPDSEGTPYDSEEGFYIDQVIDIDDLFSDYDLTSNDEVLTALKESSANDLWVERDSARGRDSDHFKWGWNAFRQAVMYETRYMFFRKKEENRDLYEFDEIDPADFLDALASYKNHGLGNISLIKFISPDTKLFRVRINTNKFSNVKDLGPPPREAAIYSNRMSPAGIPMFYGAFDEQISIIETFVEASHKESDIISTGIFQPVRDLRLLDLQALPSIPSVFDPQNQDFIQPLRFFHGFAEDIAKPVTRDGHEHIEYVPTQVITEFFRHVYRTNNGETLDGIIYRSSKNNGKPICVIFCDNKQVCDLGGEVNEKHILRLVSVHHKSCGQGVIPIPDHRASAAFQMFRTGIN